MNNTRTNFKTIYSTIKEQILKGSYLKGSLLPTENNLATEYSVSRPTIAKVYNRLQDEGYIEKKKGLGTIVIYESAKKVRTFGLLLPGGGESEIFSIINDQLLKQSEKYGFNLLWEGATANNAEIRKTLIHACCERFINKGVDGIFFSPLERVPDALEINLQICKMIENANIPLILIDRDIYGFPNRTKFDLVCINNFDAGFIMAKHLIDTGCELLYFFWRPYSATSVNMRLSGVKEAVSQHNYTFNENNIFCGNPEDVEFVKSMKIAPGKTGIICATDSTAAILMSTLEVLGIKISSDVLICGYDDMKYSNHLKYSLTSYRQPCEEIADVALELMMRRISNNSQTAVLVYLSGEIIIRESSKFIGIGI